MVFHCANITQYDLFLQRSASERLTKQLADSPVLSAISADEEGAKVPDPKNLLERSVKGISHFICETQFCLNLNSLDDFSGR